MAEPTSNADLMMRQFQVRLVLADDLPKPVCPPWLPAPWASARISFGAVYGDDQIAQPFATRIVRRLVSALCQSRPATKPRAAWTMRD